MKTFFISLLLLVSWSLFAQDSITFEYNPAGGRIARKVIKMTTLAPVQEEEDLQETPTEIEEIFNDQLAEAEIRIYPNPTKGLLFVTIDNIPANSRAQIVLFSLSGRQLLIKEAMSSNEIDITNQPNGVYIMRIIIGDQLTEWKIIKN
ncbi:T9SS type A sorting domain-containing protein [Bacteroidales bacterium OttesenSCG-928-M11]|nr:T9SS type A sorting domain-containing protein [Bacteroidales bacterium OttesenSCG-928-M11]